MSNRNDARIDNGLLKVRVFMDSAKKNREATATWKSRMPYRIIYNLQDRRIILQNFTVQGQVGDSCQKLKILICSLPRSQKD